MELKTQIKRNEILAKGNKNYIIKKLISYYEVVFPEKNSKEMAINAFWNAKKQKRLDNLNRLSKINFVNQDRTL